ncbi:Protein N-acetyltransferase, RimJ/RimL family [Pelagibacterium halotolerans]|nr:Protein N-acetyltransferase, RimJ/RimL family [Pelagibacterium halotolerans]
MAPLFRCRDKVMDTQTLRDAMPDRIRAERLVLRAPGRADIPAIAALANNAKIHAMTTLPYPYDQKDAQAFVESFARSETEHAYAIVLPGDALIGMVGLHLYPDADPEIGYWLGEPYWGRGYGTEAVGALIEAARATGHCAMLRAKARSENAASRAILEKLDFRIVGEAVSGCGSHKDVPVATYELPLRVGPA